MILFLYGEDSYRSHEKLEQIKQKYISASLGDTNLAILDLEDKSINYDQITRQILAMPFLAKTRLVITKNLLSKGSKSIQEKVEEFLKKVPDSTALLIYEGGKADQRTKLFKTLVKLSQSQEFKPLDPSQLKKWISDRLQENKLNADNSVIDKLIEYVGNDLWRQTNEINKLISFNNGLQLTGEQAELLINPKIKSNVFDLIDSIANKNIQKSHNELQKLLKTGENELYILSMIVYQFRNLLIVKDIIDKSKNSNSFQVAKEAGINPYVLSKTILQAKNFSLEDLKYIYNQLMESDLKIKTGKLEPKLALDLLILEICC